MSYGGGYNNTQQTYVFLQFFNLEESTNNFAILYFVSQIKSQFAERVLGQFVPRALAVVLFLFLRGIVVSKHRSQSQQDDLLLASSSQAFDQFLGGGDASQSQFDDFLTQDPGTSSQIDPLLSGFQDAQQPPRSNNNNNVDDLLHGGAAVGGFTDDLLAGGAGGSNNAPTGAGQSFEDELLTGGQAPTGFVDDLLQGSSANTGGVDDLLGGGAGGGVDDLLNGVGGGSVDDLLAGSGSKNYKFVEPADYAGGVDDLLAGGAQDQLNFEDVFDDDIDIGELPEHACEYCGYHDAAAVGKCLGTGKWFCNRISTGMTASHMVHHLVRSRNNHVQLHDEGPLGDTVLECYCCGTKNVFTLGFIPSKQDSVVILLCREPCLSKNALKDPNWDLSQWQPLIQDRTFVPWLVKEPTAEEALRSRPVTVGEITRMEEMWKQDPNKQLGDLDDPMAGKREVEVENVVLRYEDAYEYQSIFAPLVKLEAEYDKEAKQNQTQHDIAIRWDISLTKKRTAIFMFGREESGVKLSVGDELLIKHLNWMPLDQVGKKKVVLNPDGQWEGVGHISKFTTHEEIVLELKKKFIKKI